MIHLREYQQKIILDCRRIFSDGSKSICIQSPTGSGKTLLTAQMLKTAAARGHGSLFIVHRRELVNQSIEAFKQLNIPHGVIASGFNHTHRAAVQIASVQTLSRRLSYIRKPSFIVWDECHHCGAKSWEKIYESYPDAWHLGLTATPVRLDGRGLKKYFTQMVQGPEVRWLIDNKFLSEYKLYAPSTVNLQGVHTRMGDYANNELAGVMDKPTITGCALSHYKRLALGKRAVIFAVSIEHSNNIVKQFNEEGLNAAHIDGKTPTQERDSLLKKFARGEIKVISNVELFGEGFDLPAIECAIMLRPTASTGLYLQQVGRALRPYPGKEAAIILDHAGNALRHGLPDQKREWSLGGYEKNKSSSSTVHIRLCEKCYAAQTPGGTSCKFCGYVFEVQFREVVEKEGELVEIQANQEIAKQDAVNELWQAVTREQLIALAKKRGYKNPPGWAWLILQGRKRKYGKTAEAKG